MAATTVMYMIGLLVILVLMGFHIAVALAMTSALGIYLMLSLTASSRRKQVTS